MKPLSEQDHYEILEIPRDASPAAVERAFRLARSTFADGSLALYSVVDPHDAEAIRLRVNEAHRVLSDPVARAAYDADLDPPSEDAAPPIHFDAEPGRAAQGATAPPTLHTALGEAGKERQHPARYDGAAFRAARVRHSLDFEQIAGITKVNPRYLRYIEEENVEGLPARVYVRGFVDAFARAVGFDPKEAVAGYFAAVLENAPSAAPRRSRFLGR